MSFDPTPETKSDQCLVGVLMGPSGGGGDDSSQTRSAQDDGGRWRAISRVTRDAEAEGAINWWW